MGALAKRFEENRGNRKLCHVNPFEFFDHTTSEKIHFQNLLSQQPL